MLSTSLKVAQPATPMRGGETSNRGSPSSLFSAPSSPAPIRPQPAAPPPPLSLPPTMPSRSMINAAGPSRRPPAPGSQLKVTTRKPNWLLQPKIKRFDAPNLKPSSSLPTKASLAGASAEVPQSPSSVGGSTIQTPTSATAPRPPATLDGSSGLGPDTAMGSPKQSQAHFSPPNEPLLPPASMAETEAFLNDIMPPEYVYPSSPLRVIGSYFHFTLECLNP